jgi:hypothetical protein
MDDRWVDLTGWRKAHPAGSHWIDVFDKNDATEVWASRMFARVHAHFSVVSTESWSRSCLLKNKNKKCKALEIVINEESARSHPLVVPRCGAFGFCFMVCLGRAVSLIFCLFS